MKILTIMGTRPEIIRLSRIIHQLDQVCDHKLLYTGQNYDALLRDIFFQQLRVREPNYAYTLRSATLPGQLGEILENVGEALEAEQPDRVLILGDTNSSLGCIVAKRMGIPIFHMEAGNRCFDDRVPEEVNRRIVDHTSDILLPYTERSRQNLLREGIPIHKTLVTGNPILEVINYYAPQIESSDVMSRLNLTERGYFLVTMHRAENVDVDARLFAFLSAFDSLADKYGLPVVVSTHPHTRRRMESLHITGSRPSVQFLPPFGFPDFIRLERGAYCVLTDSGTVQEECSILHIASVTIRDVTERPETIECGGNILSGPRAEDILRCVATVTTLQNQWSPPKEYLEEHVSSSIARIVTGFVL